jgi:hypothetical protein
MFKANSKLGPALMVLASGLAIGLVAGRKLIAKESHGEFKQIDKSDMQ